MDIMSIIDTINKYSTLIVAIATFVTAIATAGLAILTGYYIREIKQEREYRLRVSHTKEIKEQVLEPLKSIIKLQWKSLKKDPDSYDFKSLFKDDKLKNFNYPMYKDLIENHLPQDISNKYSNLLKEISANMEELSKLVREINEEKIESAIPILSKLLKGEEIEIDKLKNLDPEILKYANLYFNLYSKFVKNIVSFRFIIDELDAYEVLPGVCKYLTEKNK